MRDKVLDWCRREGLLERGDQVVCAVSGGADSVAMLHCLLALQETLGIRLTAAHYNHCLRGAASDEDEAFVRRLCASWGVPLTVGRGDVTARAAATGESMEEAARRLRYGFLLEQPGLVAVAHNADDQVETVLLNLIRGTGLRGLAAMAPRQGRIIRPLLPVTRQEIEAYLAEHSLDHREDGSNEEDDALRNRLRHHVTPLLRQENPNLAGTVGRMTALLRQDETYLREQTQALLKQAAGPEGYDCRVLREAAPVLRRRAIREILQVPKPSMAHVEAAEALLWDLSGSAAVSLPGGMTLRRTYHVLQLQAQELPRGFDPVTLGPGETAELTGAGLTISVEGPVILEKTVDSLSTFALRCDMIEPSPIVCVRPRKQGDQLRLAGGRKSVKRLMIDRKIPAARREVTPVLTDGTEIFAVYGLGADPSRAARPGDRALIIKIWCRGEQCHDQQNGHDGGY